MASYISHTRSHDRLSMKWAVVDDAWTLTVVTEQECGLRKAQLAIARGNAGWGVTALFCCLGCAERQQRQRRLPA